MTRQEIKSRITNSYNQLVKEFLEIDEQNWRHPLRKDWHNTPHDLLAHLVGWDKVCLEGAKEFLSGKRPSYEGISDSFYNEKFIKEYKNLSRKELLYEFLESRRNIIKFLDNLTDEKVESANNQGLVWKVELDPASDFGLVWKDSLDGKALKMHLHTILDLSWHDLEHIEHLREFRKSTKKNSRHY